MTSPSTPERFARNFALLVTNVTKVGGLAVALNELLLRPNLRTSAVAIAAFMMAGAQLSEQAILTALDRLMGKESSETKTEGKP